METVRLTKNNITEQLYLQGDFNFKVSETFYDDLNFEPVKHITFKFNSSSPFNLNNDEAIELLSEKLKQDFKKLLRNHRVK